MEEQLVMPVIENEFMGYNLFNDIEDEFLRIHNRATMMSTIFEMNSKEGNVSEAGLTVLKGYFECIDIDERGTIFVAFLHILQENGVVFDITQMVGDAV